MKIVVSEMKFWLEWWPAQLISKIRFSHLAFY